MKTARIVRLVFALMVVACGADAAERTMTSEQIAETYLIAAKKIAALMPDSIRSVKVDAPDDSHGYVRIALESALADRGIHILTGAADNVAILSVTTERLSITVSDTWRRTFVGHREAERSVDVEVAAQLVLDDTVVWRQHTPVGTRKSLSEKELASLADPHAPVEAPRNRTAFVLETAVIMSSIIVVLYLFFTQ
jgi:hypothetical protein